LNHGTPPPPLQANLLFHPVRLRIAQLLTGGRRLTAREIAQGMPQVPQASLYRHLSLLVKGGIVTVAEERPVQNRNLVEKVYALDLEAANIPPEVVAQASPDDQRRYFTLFVLMVLGDFERYLQWQRRSESGERGETASREAVEYQHYALYLSDEEAQQLLADLRAVRVAAQGKPPSPERLRRYLTMTLMPGFEATVATEMSGGE
jgi:DNA-binding transcriptional ArsR family regulator